MKEQKRFRSLIYLSKDVDAMIQVMPALRGKLVSRSIITYDHALRRVWVCGQRVHHGATGVGATTLGLLALVAHGAPRRVGLRVLLIGILMMIHDGKDRHNWFERGWQG